MKIRITIEDRVITATLYDNNTSRDFISLLPLTLTIEDYAGTEKISYLPKRLSTEDAPSGIDPQLEISLITLPGQIWRFLSRILGTQTDLFFWEEQMVTWRL